MCNAPFTGTPLSHRVYSERAGLSLEHPESSGVRDNVLELCLTGIFLERHHFLRPLQTSLHCRQGKKDFKFTNDTGGAENISRTYWFKS